MSRQETPPLADAPNRAARRRKPTTEQQPEAVEPATVATSTGQEQGTQESEAGGEIDEDGDGLGDLASSALAQSADLEDAGATAQQAEGGTVVEFPKVANWGALSPDNVIPRDEDTEDEHSSETNEADPDLPRQRVDRPAPVASGRARLCTTTVTIEVELSEHERIERGQKLAATTSEEDRLRAAKSAYLSTWNGEMKELQAERQKLSKTVSSGKDEVDVNVHIEADYDRGIAEYVETTTGRVVQTRALTVDEMTAGRQRRLPGM